MRHVARPVPARLFRLSLLAVLMLSPIVPARAADAPGARPASAGEEFSAAWPAAPGDLPAFDPAAFERLAQAERLAFVRTALAWRESQLQNFAYALTAEVRNEPIREDLPLPADYDREFEPKSYALRRDGRTYVFSGEEYGRRFSSKWDGLAYRSVSSEIDKPDREPQASIRPQEGDGPRQQEYNHLLGFRSFGIDVVRAGRGHVDAKPATLPDVLRHYDETKKPVRVELVHEAGVPLIRLHALDDYTHRLYWLDPARHYLPVRYHGRHVSSDYPAPAEFDGYDKKRGVNLNWHDVVEARLAQGFWVPVKVVTLYKFDTQDRDNVQCRRTYTATSFERGTVRADDLRVPFPAGTVVVDAAAHVAYRVGEGGAAEAQPLFDELSGKGVTASAEDLAAALAANPLADDAPPERRAEATARLAVRREAQLRERDPLRGRPAPAFPDGAMWINGEPLTWDGLRGKVVILDFFAEWCAPCRNDLAASGRLSESLAKRGIVIVGVHAPGSERPAIDELVEEFKLRYPICVDTARPAHQEAEGFGAMSAACGVQGMPHALVVDVNGVVVSRGSFADALDRAEELLRKPAPPGAEPAEPQQPGR